MQSEISLGVGLSFSWVLLSQVPRLGGVLAHSVTISRFTINPGEAFVPFRSLAPPKQSSRKIMSLPLRPFCQRAPLEILRE